MWYLNMTWRNAAIRQSSPASAPPPSASNPMDDMMQRAVVFTAVLMAILGGTLCVVGLERLIRGRFTLFSMVRFLLRFTFVLFLPLLSYMRAKAKDNEVLFVLLWMLLIELFRKKVEAMVPSANGSFSRSASRFRLMGHSDEVTRLVWIGFLIYTNVDWQRKKAMMPMFAILWSLAVAKLVQRVINEWKAQDSLSAAGSANLIAGYMQHLLEQQQEEEGRRHTDVGSGSGSGAAAGASPDPDLDAVMGKCQYVVMGEEKLVLNKKERRRRQTTGSKSKVLITTPHCGHGVGRFPHDQDELKHVHLLVDLDKVKNLVTVKDIWQNLGRWLARFGNRRPKFIDHMCLMCLSFSLFKLLRRRFEHYPMVEVGSKMARRLMVEGVLNDHEPEPSNNASRAFRVIQMELDFLDNYYQAGVPVVMSAPWLFLINFLSSLLFVSIYVLAVAILVVIPDNNDNDSLANLAKYFIITMLLVMTLLAVEMTDFLTTYLFSNWFLVHLLCLYVAPGGCLWNFLVRPIICCFIAYRLLVFNSLKFVLKLTGRPVNEKKMKIRQVSILQVCEPVHKMFAWASQATLEAEAKVAIVEGLKKGIKNPDTGGDVSLPHDIGGFSIRGKTTTEIILACHLATELLEVKHGKPKKKKKPKQKQKKAEDDSDPQTVATTLSRYCMYLVARVPELLPDDERWVSDRYEDVKRCLKEASRRCCCSTWCCPWRRAGRWKAVADMKVQLKEATAQAGVELYQQLEKGKGKEESSAADDAWKWKVLAEFWVKLLIYLAPSNDVEGHAKALATSGNDLITCLWALCTHAGIKRHPPEPATAELHAAGTHQV